MSELLEKGRAAAERQDAEERENVAYNIREARAEIRRAWISHFYEETLVQARWRSYMRVPGPLSPDPKIKPLSRVGSLGGDWRLTNWHFEWEGIEWIARYTYRDNWSLHFYVLAPRRGLRRRRWVEVHAPNSLYRAMRRS